MSFPKVALLIFALACAGSVRAADEKDDVNELSALPGGADPNAETSDLLPPVAPAKTKEKSENKSKGKNTSLRPPADAEDLELRIRYREARTKALADTAVQAAWAESRAAKTDFAKRDAMRRYYKALFAKMLKSDKRIAKLVDERQHNSLRRLDQTRIEPTVEGDDEDLVSVRAE